MMLLVVVFLLIRKAYTKALLIVVFVFGYILMINITHNFPWRHSNYFERMYLLLIPLSVLPFFREIYLTSRYKRPLEILFVLIIFYRGVLIVLHAKEYSNRIKDVEEFVASAQAQGSSKFYVEGATYPDNPALNEWSFPMETILFSSLAPGAHTVTISLKSDLDAPEIDTLLNERSFHLRLNEVFNDDWLNQRYFHLADGNYMPLPKNR